MANTATGPDTQEQQRSSQPATEQADGRTATPSLVRSSRSASRTRSEMPHGRRGLAMATELLRYQPAPDYHNDWLQRIEELVALQVIPWCSPAHFDPNRPSRTTRRNTRHPDLSSVARNPSLGRKRIPATGLANPGRGQDMKQAVRWSVGHAPTRPRF
ncbi:hypothetical protein D1007_20161 [Hordeum vulgare]|nr:hypothetical protein D1007_20161 [Hordeum vulgare]